MSRVSGRSALSGAKFGYDRSSNFDNIEISTFDALSLKTLIHVP